MQQTFKFKLSLFLIGLFFNCYTHGMEKEQNELVQKIANALDKPSTKELLKLTEGLTKKDFPPRCYHSIKQYATANQDALWKEQRVPYFATKAASAALFVGSIYAIFSSPNFNRTPTIKDYAIAGSTLSSIISLGWPWKYDKARKCGAIVHRLGLRLGKDYENPEEDKSRNTKTKNK